jgi:hypothetical protein
MPITYAALREAVADMHSVGGGVWRLRIIRVSDAVPLLLAAIDGNGVASALLRVANDTVVQVQEAPTPCLLCEAVCCSDTPPSAILTLSADVPEADRCVSFVTCIDCTAASDAVVEARAVEWLGRYLIPDLRMLPPMPPAGHG